MGEAGIEDDVDAESEAATAAAAAAVAEIILGLLTLELDVVFVMEVFISEDVDTGDECCVRLFVWLAVVMFEDGE